MERAATASLRAQSLVALATTQAQVIMTLVTPLLFATKASLLLAQECKHKATAYLDPTTAPPPECQQTAEDGTILEKHANEVHVQRRPDGGVVVRSQVHDTATLAPSSATVVFSPDHAGPAALPTVVQLGEVAETIEQVQFKGGGDAVYLNAKGDTVQVLFSTGKVIVVTLASGDIVQAVPVAPSSSPTQTAAPPVRLLPSGLVAQWCQTTVDNDTGSHVFQNICRFGFESSPASESELSRLKGCTFAKQPPQHQSPRESATPSSILEHAPADEILKSHWTEDRLVCCFRDGTVCERRKDGRVVCMEQLDEAVQAAVEGENRIMGKGTASAATTTTNNNNTNTNTNTKKDQKDQAATMHVRDIDFSGGNKTLLVQQLQAQQHVLAQAKKEAVRVLIQCCTTSSAAYRTWQQASVASAMALLVRQRALEVVSLPLPESAAEAATKGIMMQETSSEKSPAILMVQLKNGTQYQRAVDATGTEKVLNCALSNSEEIVVEHSCLMGAVFQQPSPIDLDPRMAEQTVVVLKEVEESEGSGAQVVFRCEDSSHPGVLTHAVVALASGEEIQLKYSQGGGGGGGGSPVVDNVVEVVHVVGGGDEAPTVQFMALTTPMRVVVAFSASTEATPVLHVQMTRLGEGEDGGYEDVEDGDERAAGLIFFKGGVKHSLTSDDAFTIETEHPGSNSSAVQLTSEGHLIVVKEDGSQWRFTGKELHAMTLSSSSGGRSPRAKIEAAQQMDAELNRASC